MIFPLHPYKIYAALPDSTLLTKIREENWKLDKLFPVFKGTKLEFEKLRKGIKSKPMNLMKLRHSIELLATEIRTGIKDLKLINYYDSTILYLYYKLLHNILKLCGKRKSKLMEKAKKYDKLVKGLDIAETELIKVYKILVKKLENERWDLEKLAQHEFRWRKFTFRSMKNINRKIKVEALMVKKVIPEKNYLLNKIIEQLKSEEPQDLASEYIISLAKLVSKSIDRISKDFAYISKLISKFEDEMKKLKESIEKLKKNINNLIKDREKSDKIMKLVKSWDDAITYKEHEINTDLIEIFRNIFVEHKHIATRPLEKAA